jgi:hypothetical protein
MPENLLYNQVIGERKHFYRDRNFKVSESCFIYHIYFDKYTQGETQLKKAISKNTLIVDSNS